MDDIDDKVIRICRILNDDSPDTERRVRQMVRELSAINKEHEEEENVRGLAEKNRNSRMS